MRRAAKLGPTCEDDLHIQVADFLRLAWPPDLLFWHTPNGGDRPTITRTNKAGETYSFSPAAQQLKRMGTLPGFPDLAFLLPGGRLAVIELKFGKNTLSQDQIDVRTVMLANKVGYAVCRTLEEVVDTLTSWLALYGRELRVRLS